MGDCEIEGQKLGHTHGGGVTRAMEEDEALDPIGRRVVGANVVMFDANFVSHGIEEFRVVVPQWATV
jgi:hypothetical protein